MATSNSPEGVAEAVELLRKHMAGLDYPLHPCSAIGFVHSALQYAARELNPEAEMHEYMFDVKLWTVARVTAANEKEAREKLHAVVDCVDLSGTPGTADNGVTLTEASTEGEADLIEIDGEAV